MKKQNKARRDLSWGRYPAVIQKETALQSDTLPELDGTVLAHGMGRSYGDSCLNPDQWILQTRGLHRLIAFDRCTGVLRCEAGVTLEEIIQLVLPLGWFLPVTPGTKFVTIGGAVANDVHGKNHHLAGTFGCHVLQFELLRSDGERLCCSAQQNTDFFKATIGGLGLTGLITWVEIQLKAVNNAAIEFEEIRYNNVDEFRQLVAESQSYEYTVAWVDCLATDNKLGRGLFSRGQHAGALLNAEDHPQASLKKKSIPFSFPGWALNTWSVYAFNQLYYYKALKKIRSGLTHYDPFFYPLDAVHSWNRIYGSRGFFQYQCVVPANDDYAVIKEVMKTIAGSGAGSFLTVLKEFGDVPSPGMMSFPQPGITFALDFPNHGHDTLKLLDSLDDLVMQAQGKVYPAKDARMSAKAFQQYYPQWQEFAQYIDPQFSSGFWRRVTDDAPQKD